MVKVMEFQEYKPCKGNFLVNTALLLPGAHTLTPAPSVYMAEKILRKM